MSKNHGPKGHAVAPASTTAETGSPAGPAETGTAASAEGAQGTTAEPDPEAGKAAGANGVEEISEEERQRRTAEWEQRLAEETAAREKLRAETPPQTVKIRPEPKGKLLGMIVRGQDGKVRTARLEDWRTEQVELLAGDHVIILVLAGEDLTHFEDFERREREQNAPPPAPAADPAPAVEG